jgi:hypothetical protein
MPATLTSKDYPNLIAEGDSVDTIAVPAVLAAYNWSPDTERSRRLALFVDAFFTKFPALQNPPFHPKWKEISPCGSARRLEPPAACAAMARQAWQPEKNRDRTFQSAIHAVPERRPHRRAHRARSELEISSQQGRGYRNAKGIRAAGVPTRTSVTAPARMPGGNRTPVLLKSTTTDQFF